MREIFAYFDHPITNAYTEALNGLVKIMNRNGRGYSFDAIRAKVLYSTLQSVRRPRFDRTLIMENACAYVAPDVVPAAGPSISTLTELFQQERAG